VTSRVRKTDRVGFNCLAWHITGHFGDDPSSQSFDWWCKNL